MKLITLDFETYYDKDYSLSKMTTESYIRDPRFEVIGVGIKIDDGATQWFSGPDEIIASRLHGLIDWSDSALLCHNTAFDAAILAWHYQISPKFYFDTLGMARPLHGLTVGGSLKALAEHYNIGRKGTEVIAALGKRRADFTPQELSQYGTYCKNDVELTYDLFKLLKKDFPRQEFLVIDMMLRMYTDPVLELDSGVLKKHLVQVKDNKEQLMAKVMVGTDELMSNDKMAQVLRDLGVEPPKKVSARTGKEAYAFAKTDMEFKYLLDHEDERVQAVVAARLGVKSTIEETRTESFIRISERGKLPILLNYYGAHTGRASGGDKVNLQNLPRGGALRQAIVAPKGHVLVACDSSQIEARTVAWLAGEKDLVQAFANGDDIYSSFASDVYEMPINKKDNPMERHVGKTSILGLGYGMSAAKFKLTLKTGKPSVEMELQDCERVVGIYRTKYPHIVKLWRSSQFLMEAVAKGAKFAVGPDDLVYATKAGIHLPNGMMLRYPELQRGEDGYTYKQRRETKKIYGAKVTENVVQALARIVVFDQMLAINKRYKVVLTVHDEVVIVAPEQEADEAMAFMVECMSVAPDWAQGLPVTCEAGIGKNYGECK